MRLRVDETGDVIDGWIDRTSGFDELDQSALKEAVKSWKLRPGMVDGVPTTMDYKFAVTFRLVD